MNGDCDDARLEASRGPEPYGEAMLQDRRAGAQGKGVNRPETVLHHEYECLFGIAGLLGTDDCRVWWSTPETGGEGT